MKTWAEIWNPTSFVIVHLNYRSEGLCITASYQKKNKPALDDQEFDSIGEVIKKFGKSKAYAIHVNGTGILTRFVEFLPGYKEQLIVNGDKDDFYFTSYNDGHQVATSFFRKNLIEEIVATFASEKISITSISCGIVPVFNLISANESINFDYQIQIVDSKIKTFKRSESPQDRSVIQSVFKDKNQAINEGIVLSQVTNLTNYSNGLSDQEQKQSLENYSQFNRFKFFGILAVSSILMALLINYFYMNNLNNQVADLEAELTLNNDNLSLLEQLKQEKIRKELLIQSSGVNQLEYHSFYIDKIGETVPKSISLQAMNVFPLKENLKEKRKVEIFSDAIEIYGMTPGSQILDDWMERMERFAWVKSVELLNYLKTENGGAEFKLIITLNK